MLSKCPLIKIVCITPVHYAGITAGMVLTARCVYAGLYTVICPSGIIGHVPASSFKVI